MPATPDPDLALQLAKATVDVYSEATGRMLEIVAKRLARGITEPGWAERKLVEQARLRDEALRILDDLQRDGAQAITEAVEQAYAIGAKQGVADLKVLGDEGRITAQFGATHTRAVEALVQETVTRVRSTHLRVLRHTLDAYRDIISEVAAPGVLTGTETRLQATQRALNRFAARGITGFVDKAGRQWELETYAEMATRTSVGRAQTQGTLDRFVTAGRDLVIVSDAPEECKVCRPWEGRVLTISGGTPPGTTLQNGFTVSGTVADATGAGLFHANCRHALGAYIDGATRLFTNTEDPHGDTIRQEQRSLERAKRKWKREEKVALTDEARREARQQIAVHDRHLRLIVSDRRAYAQQRAEFLRSVGHPHAAKWEQTAAGIAPGSRGKRLAYREQIDKAR